MLGYLLQLLYTLFQRPQLTSDVMLNNNLIFWHTRNESFHIFFKAYFLYKFPCLFSANSFFRLCWSHSLFPSFPELHLQLDNTNNNCSGQTHIVIVIWTKDLFFNTSFLTFMSWFLSFHPNSDKQQHWSPTCCWDESCTTQMSIRLILNELSIQLSNKVSPTMTGLWTSPCSMQIVTRAGQVLISAIKHQTIDSMGP